MELCGLLRKTGAKIPAGPFRDGDARQWSSHVGGAEAAAHSHESAHRLIKTKAGELIGSYLRESLGIAATAEMRLTCAG